MEWQQVGKHLLLWDGQELAGHIITSDALRGNFTWEAYAMVRCGFPQTVFGCEESLDSAKEIVEAIAESNTNPYDYGASQ